MAIGYYGMDEASSQARTRAIMARKSGQESSSGRDSARNEKARQRRDDFHESQKKQSDKMKSDMESLDNQRISRLAAKTTERYAYAGEAEKNARKAARKTSGKADDKRASSVDEALEGMCHNPNATMGDMSEFVGDYMEEAVEDSLCL